MGSEAAMESTTEERLTALEAEMEATKATVSQLAAKLHFVGGVLGRVFADVDRAAS